MAPKPIEVLKKGLKLLQLRISSRKNQLLARRAENKSITSEDERWLDGEGNLVDEHVAIDALEKASDFERALEKLPEQQQAAVERLRGMAAEEKPELSGKRKQSA